MKTLIEKFTETVRLTATNFCLTDGLNRDGIDSISFTQHKRGLARYIYGKSCCLGGLTKSSNPKLYAIATDEIVYIINLESFGLDAVKDKEKLPMNTITLEDYRRTWIKRQETLLDISAEKVTLRLYAIVREGQIYFYDLNCFGIYAGEDKQKLPKDCMTLKEYQELWKERQRQLIKEYQEEFLEGKLLREKIQDIQLSEKSSNKCKCDARRHLLHKTFPDDLAISTDISISKQDCVDHLCGFINLKEKIKQKLIDENNDLSLRLAKNLVVKDYMEKHINVEPWELELVENLKDSMKSVKITFECNGRTVEGRVLVASLLLNLNCGYDFDLYDFTSISEGKKVFSKLKSFCLPGMSKLFCKDIVLITYNGKTLYKRAKK